MLPENKPENIHFVNPPEYTETNLQNLGIKLKSFGLGDKVHMDINDVQNAWAMLEQAQRQRGGVGLKN